jgi:hypothetical protein
MCQLTGTPQTIIREGEAILAEAAVDHRLVLSANDRMTIISNGQEQKIVVDGAREEVKIGCTSVSFAAIERIYALYRRHKDKSTYVA